MERYRRVGLTVLFIAILASGAVACSGFSLLGGLASGALGVLAVVFWLATAATQTGCEAQACLSVLHLPDDSGIGPCLSPIPQDAGLDGGRDATVGPCLSDSSVGPCLGAPLDAGEEDTGIIGPCLSQPPPDAEPADVDDAGDGDASEPIGSLEGPGGGTRRDAIERLERSGVLPADVAARLRGSGKGEV